MRDYYWRGARNKRRAQSDAAALQSAPSAVITSTGAGSTAPAQGWLTWLQVQFVTAAAAMYPAGIGKGQPAQYSVLRRVAKQLLYRLLAALFGKVVNAAVLPGVGTLLQILEEDRHQRRDHQVAGFKRVKAGLEHFASLPSGDENESTLAELQELVRVVLPGLELLDDYQTGAFTLARLDDRLDQLMLALQAPSLAVLTAGAASQLVEGVRYLRLFCYDVDVLKSTAREGAPAQHYVAVVANSGFMRAMLPAELHWFVDTVAELGTIVGAFRPILAGEGDRYTKAFRLLELIAASRLGSLLLPQLDAVLRPAVEHLFDAAEPAEDDAHQQAGGRSMAVLRWLVQIPHLGPDAAHWAPEWLTSVFGYLDRLVDGYTLYADSEPFPAKPLEQLAWGVELLQQARFRRLLESLFGHLAVSSLTLPFEVFEHHQPVPAGSSHQAQSRWANGVLERDDVAHLLASSNAGPQVIRGLREALAWGPLLARLTMLQDRLDEDASYAQIARALFMELGAMLVEQLSLPSHETMASAGKYLASYLGDYQGAAVLGAYLALRQADTQGSYSDAAGHVSEYFQEHLEALTGQQQPDFRQHQWLFKAAQRGVAIAGRWWNATAASEAPGLLESAIRLVKIVFDLSPQTHAALDAIPLLPLVMDAFNDAQVSHGPVARLDHFAQALQDSPNPGLKRLGTQAERWVVNRLADAIGAMLPQQSPLLGGLPGAAASQTEGLDLQTSVAAQQHDLGGLAIPSGRWRSEQIAMGGNVMYFAALAPLLYAAKSFRSEWGDQYASVPGSEPRADNQAPRGLLRRYRGTALGIAGALVTASVGIGLHGWAAQRRQQEAAQQAADEPYTPLVPGAPITLLQAVENYLQSESGDTQILADAPAVARLLHELFDHSPDPDSSTHSASMVHSIKRRSVEQDRATAPARIRVRRDGQGALQIVPVDSQPQVGDELRTLLQPPQATITSLTVAARVDSYFTARIEKILKERAEESGELPPELASIEAFAEDAGAVIKNSHFLRPPGFSGDEELEIEFQSYEDNPLLYFTSPVTQPYVAVHTFFSPNAATDLPAERRFYRRFLFGMQGETRISARELLLGNLKKAIGDNSYWISAKDPLQQEYFKSLNTATIAEDYDKALVAHMAAHESKMAARVETAVYRRLERAVGRQDYSPRERLDAKLAYITPVYAEPVASFSGRNNTPGKLEHTLLNAFRYVDLAERIDIVVFMNTGQVHDAYDAARASTVGGFATTVTRIETVTQILRSTASINSDVFNAIARRIGKAELDYARMQRNEHGTLTYSPEFITRIEALHVADGTRVPGPLRLKSLEKLSVQQFAQLQVNLLQRDLQNGADARSMTGFDQQYAYWTHKAEFVGNFIATGLTILGALPLQGATAFARAAWLAAVTTSTLSTVLRSGMVETDTQRKDLLKRWLMTLLTETFFLVMGEFVVDRVVNRMKPVKPPTAGERMSGMADFLQQNADLNTLEFTHDVAEHFSIFSFAEMNAASISLRRRIFEQKVRELMKNAVNSALLSKALLLSPLVQAAFDETDFDLIGTPESLAKELPAQLRDRSTGNPGADRYLPRDTLPSISERNASVDWSIDADGEPQPAKLLLFSADSDENQWGETVALDPRMPGNYRSIGRRTYRHLGSDPANFYGNQKVRLVWRDGSWQVIRIVLDAQQIEEARLAMEKQKTAATPVPTLRPTVSPQPGQPNLDWVISDERGNLKVSQPQPLPIDAAHNRWKAHDNDDPHRVGVYRRLGQPPTFNVGITYQYLGALDDRSAEQLYSLHEAGGRWQVRSAPLPDRSYDYKAPDRVMTDSSAEATKQMTTLQYMLREFEHVNPRQLPGRKDTWLEQIETMKVLVDRLESRLQEDKHRERPLAAFAATQLDRAGILGHNLDYRLELREQRTKECAEARTLLERKIADRPKLIKAWDKGQSKAVGSTAMEYLMLRKAAERLRLELAGLPNPDSSMMGAQVNALWGVMENRAHWQVEEQLRKNLEEQRFAAIRYGQLWRGMGLTADPLPLFEIPPIFPDIEPPSRPAPAPPDPDGSPEYEEPMLEPGR